MKDLVSMIRVNAKQAKPFGSVINFDAGDDGIICIDGTGETVVVSETERAADTTIVLSKSNLEKLLRGKLNPAMAAMTGKIKVQGDMSLALKLTQFL